MRYKLPNIAITNKNLDALIAKNDPSIIAELIKNGHAREYYEQWKTHYSNKVRYALAVNGYFPETFINDKNPNVCKAVVQYYPEYCDQLLAQNTKGYWEFVADLINENTDSAIIKTFLDAPIPKTVTDKKKLKAIRIVYKCRTSTPNTIEKTMTPKQLFEANSPFWAVGLTLDHIDFIQNQYVRWGHDTFFKYFDEFIDPNKSHNAAWELYDKERLATK